VRDLAPWEPEETVGKLWHRFASRIDAPPVFEDARVDLPEVAPRLAVFFRGLGGAHSVEIKPVAEEQSRHRLSLRRRLGTVAERLPRASFDGEALRLPRTLAMLPQREANAALYVWLSALAAHAATARDERDPLRADLAALCAARAMTEATLARAPGLRRLQAELARACLEVRRVSRLPAVELAVERVVRRMLGERAPLCALGEQFLAAIESGQVDSVAAAPRGYRPFLPVPLWLDLGRPASSPPLESETGEAQGSRQEGDGPARRARRHAADQARRKDNLVLYRFEAVLSWAEFLNLNRRVEDDDTDVRKAADDQDEIGLGQVSKSPATRLKLHLDLAPEDAEREALSGRCTYPEWDCRSGTYLPAHVRVLASPQATEEDPSLTTGDPGAARRIRAVKRQFEALRPARLWTAGHVDGDELDIDAAIRSAADIRAAGEGSDRVWRQYRPRNRDLAVAILLDTSRSTESAVTGRSVIDIEREALTALAWGIDACGDDLAIHAFSSLRRHRVFVRSCKEFGEPMSAAVEARIAALRPGFYTRLGAAIRHAAAQLARQSRRRRLLIVVTDGKPNDLDHYEGRHGIEDSTMAVREARRAGHAVFGITIDRDGKSWFPRIFGQGGYALVPHPDKLIRVLPAIYRQLVFE
jgi:nitric oxide reductase NorD protein